MPRDTREPQEILGHVTASRVALTSAIYGLSEAELQALTLQQAIELFETAHYRLFGLLSSLQPEQWNGYVRAWVRGSTWGHFEEHSEQIRAWRAGRYNAQIHGLSR